MIPVMFPYPVQIQPVPGRMFGGPLTQFEYDSLVAELNRLNTSSRGHMPDWIFDQDGNFAVSLQDIVEHDLLFICIRDKKGSQFVQDNFPSDPTSPLRKQIFEMILESNSLYSIAMDMFGNFVVQKLITDAGADFGPAIAELLAGDAPNLAFNRFSCRVIQKAIDVFPIEMLEPILEAFRGYVLSMATDQSANHVLQKIIDQVAPTRCRFVIDEMCEGHNMDRIICNKFGCRVVQFCVEKLTSETQSKKGRNEFLLRKLLDKITKKSFQYCQDEYANYIVQHIIKDKSLGYFRDRVLMFGLTGNLVVLSQAKYSSHVIEQAFEHAPHDLLHTMISEIFHGPINPKTGRDSLDQMLFDQYGNYVIQRILNIGIQVRHKERKGNANWFDKLTLKVTTNAQALLKYSSGKRIIETLSAELGYSII